MRRCHGRVWAGEPGPVLGGNKLSKAYLELENVLHRVKLLLEPLTTDRCQQLSRHGALGGPFRAVSTKSRVTGRLGWPHGRIRFSAEKNAGVLPRSELFKRLLNMFTSPRGRCAEEVGGDGRHGGGGRAGAGGSHQGPVSRDGAGAEEGGRASRGGDADERGRRHVEGRQKGRRGTGSDRHERGARLSEGRGEEQGARLGCFRPFG